MSTLTNCVCKYKDVVPHIHQFAICDGRCQTDPDALAQIERWAEAGKAWRERREKERAALDAEPRNGE